MLDQAVITRPQQRPQSGHELSHRQSPQQAWPVRWISEGLLANHDPVLSEPHTYPHCLTHPLPYPMVISGDQLLEQGAIQTLHLVHFLDVTPAQQLGELLCVEVIIFISLLGDEPIAPWLANYHLVNGMVQATPEPAGQRSFFDNP